MRIELEHRAVVITKPEPKKRQGAYIGIDDIGDVMKPEQSQNFFFDVVFGPKYIIRITKNNNIVHMEQFAWSILK